MNIADITGAIEKPPTSVGKNLLEEQGLGKNSFLRLLTVQLTHQDPLDPVSNESFVAQLAQFSSLESLQNIEKAISETGDNEALFAMNASIIQNTAVSMIGKRVHVEAEDLTYRGDGTVEFGYDLTGPANRVDLAIVNEKGKLVRTLTDDSPDGFSGVLSWDGEDTDGNVVPAGVYRFAPTAVNGQGNFVTTFSQLTGVVAGVRYEDGEPILIFDGGETPMTGVSRISQGTDA